MLLASLRLSVLALTLLTWTMGENFYSGFEPETFAQAGVGILVNPQVASCVEKTQNMPQSCHFFN